MSRIRTIKPELLASERLGTLGDAAFKAFVGAITLADDYGNLRGSVAYFAGQVFWSEEEEGVTKARGALDALAGAGLILRYVVEGRHFIHICGWSEHQRVDKPGKPRCPPPPDPGEPRDDSGDSRDRDPEPPPETPGKVRESLAPDRDLDHDHDRDLDHDGDPRAGARARPPPPPPPPPTPQDVDRLVDAWNLCPERPPATSNERIRLAVLEWWRNGRSVDEAVEYFAELAKSDLALGRALGGPSVPWDMRQALNRSERAVRRTLAGGLETLPANSPRRPPTGAVATAELGAAMRARQRATDDAVVVDVEFTSEQRSNS